MTRQSVSLSKKNDEWLKNVTSGDYQNYYKKQYH